VFRVKRRPRRGKHYPGLFGSRVHLTWRALSGIRPCYKVSSADAMAAGRADLTLAERRLNLATSSTAAEIAQLKAWPY
jgi:hypothetical protein